MTWAAIFAITLAFVGKLGGFLSTIPMPVMGGIMILMFGMVTMVGVSILVKVDDLTEARNMVIASVILVIGVGGLNVPFGDNLVLGGIGLAGIVGVLINLALPNNSSNSE
jgi:uracil permease